MTIDCHSHLDDERLRDFLKSLEDGAKKSLRIFSNSVDVSSSEHNLELSNKFESVSAFVGIHPEIFSKQSSSQITIDDLDEMCEKISFLSTSACGIGEIGLDAKYGNMDEQELLLRGQLEIAESSPKLALTLHTRGTTFKTLEILSSFSIRNSVLFHWFSGSEQELSRINSLGYFASFGLPILFSKRAARLVSLTSQEFLLSETDSPIIFESVSKEENITPFAVSSVIFAMSAIRSVTFEEMLEIIQDNANLYLKRKTH